MAPGPPIVGMPNSASPGPASVVQAMWGNLTVLGLLQGHFYGVSIGLVWESTGKTFLGLYQGTLNSPWIHYGARPPIVGMPHPAMAGPASVVQATWGNLTVLGLFQGLFYRVSIGLAWEWAWV